MNTLNASHKMSLFPHHRFSKNFYQIRLKLVFKRKINSYKKISKYALFSKIIRLFNLLTKLKTICFYNRKKETFHLNSLNSQ